MNFIQAILNNNKHFYCACPLYVAFVSGVSGETKHAFNQYILTTIGHYISLCFR